MAKYLLGIDVGTSVVKCCIMDLEGTELATASRIVPTEVPNPRWAEADMGLVWKGVTEIIPEALAKTGLKGEDIAGIGVTGQGDGSWMIDKDGNPVDKAILWTDGRAADLIGQWLKDGTIDRCFDITGSGAYAGSSNTILRWRQDNQPDLVKRAYKSLWAMDWVEFCLTGVATTDMSNPSISLLDIVKEEWSDDVIKMSGIEASRHVLPDLCKSKDVMGYVTEKAAHATSLIAGTPVVKGMFDVVASATGVGCVHAGDACSILGTTLFNEGIYDKPPFEPKGVGMSIVHGVPGLYLRAMGVNYGTPNLEWFLKQFGFPYKVEAERRGVNVYYVLDEVLRSTEPGAGGIIYSPYLCPGGERAPFNNPEARAQFFGITEENNRDQMLRAVYEGVGLAMRDSYDSIPGEISRIALSGGGCKSDMWCQILSDVTGKALYVPKGTEFGAKGVAMFAGVAVGLFTDIEDAVSKTIQVDREFFPNLENTKKYDGLFKVYRQLRDEVVECWDMLAEARKAL